MVGAADIFEHTVGTPTRQIARAIQPRACSTKRIRNETLRRKLTAPPIAARQTGAADIKLPGNSDRRKVEVAIQNVQRGVADRTAQRRGGVRGIKAMTRRPHRGLGRAVQVPDLPGLRHQSPRQVRRQRLAAAQHPAARWKRTLVIQQHPPGRRRRLDQAHTVRGGERLEPGRIMRRGAIRQHHARADRQRSHSSNTAMSNDSEVRPSTRSSAVMPGCSAIVARKFVTASWRTITPFGTPVEPEV